MRLPEPGDTFEGYRINAVLGSGGFARVYGATSLDIGRSVALKVLTPESDGTYNPRLVQRFRREAKVVAGLQDPHTLSLFAHGQAPNGLLYMTFERLEGDDLSTVLVQRERLNERDAVHIIRQVLLSLREAHEHGLLHRDIKPENIRVFRHADDPLFVKVMDFGIAKSIIEPDTPLTRTGEFVGTPRYMAPEQLTDKPLTPATDIFSVGLVLHDMLFGLESRAKPSLSGFHVPESALISPHLRAILNHALTGPPEKRLGSAQRMLRVLESPPASSDVQRHRAPSSQSELPASSGRSNAWPALIAVTCIFVVGAVGIMLRTPDVPPPQRAPTQRSTNPLGAAPPTAAPDLAGPMPSQPDMAVAADHGTMEGPCIGLAQFSGHTTVSRMVGLREVSFPVFVPKSYDSSTRHPLVILIHDQLASSGKFIRAKSLVRLAEKHGFLMYAPEDELVEPWMDPSEDKAMVLSGLDLVKQDLCVDPDRIYAIGHGRGTKIVERLSCETPFAAIATTNYTGRAGMEEVNCDKPVPHIYLHGMRDPFHPANGGPSCTGKARESVSDREARLRRYRGCSGSSRVLHEQGESTCMRWDCEVPFVSCHVDGGHNWSDIGDRVIDTASCESDEGDYNYSKRIWKFFSTTPPSTR